MATHIPSTSDKHKLWPSIEIDTKLNDITVVKVNGKPVRGVRSIQFDIGIDRIPVVTIETLASEVKLNGEAVVRQVVEKSDKDAVWDQFKTGWNGDATP